MPFTNMATGLMAICTPSPFLVFAVILLVAYLFYRVYASYQILRWNGIPQGPTPVPFLGNYLDLKKMGIAKFYEYLCKNYGSVVGFYIGRCPVVLVTDLEFIKEITVRKFENFVDRATTGVPSSVSEDMGGLFFAKGLTWKSHRRILTPAFSTAKLKVMVPHFKRSCDNLIEKLGERVDSSKSIDVCRMYRYLTLETVLATAFGRIVNIQRGKGEKLEEALNEGMDSFEKSGSTFGQCELTAILSNFPWMEGLFSYGARWSKLWQARNFISKTATELVRLRRAENNRSKYKDLLQLIIDARLDNESSGGGTTDIFNIGLNDREIASHSAVFVSVGAHTTSRTLSYASYLLAIHPDIQERLRTEINDYFCSNLDKPLYEAIQDLQYLDMVVRETLRLTISTERTRYCAKTTKFGQYTIPEGTLVHIGVHVIHYNPDYWPDPHKFDPERFLPEEVAKRPQLAFMPFGWGLRNCIGMRFALLQVKLVLVEILKKYKFVQVPEIEVPVEFAEGGVTSSSGVYLRIEA